jgi:acyl-CoA thioesterase FadM
LLIIGGNLFVRENFLSVYILYYSYGIISTGVTFLAVGYNKLNKFRTELYNSEYEKNEIDEFYEKYGIVYKTEFNFKEKIHGIQKVVVKMEFKNWRRKRTTTTYKINC